MGLPLVYLEIFICWFIAIQQVLAYNDNNNNNSNKAMIEQRTFIDDYDEFYTNTWVIHLPGGTKKVEELVQGNNLTFLGAVGSLDDLYMIRHNADTDFYDNIDRVTRRTRRNTDFVEKTLGSHDVQFFQQQKILHREKRGYFKDPLYSQQWYLENQDDVKGECSLDMNIVSVWKKGITGKGVVVTVVDDGIDYKHPDLKANYDAQASYDYVTHDDDPLPSKAHGTRCAGEIAAEVNNSVCGAGVAFNAKIGGIRMLDGEHTDAIEASALSHKRDYIDIYSNSWGPLDNGASVSGPQHLAMKAIMDGIAKGRNGLGSIYVWATGNGGLAKDYCSCDGYVNLPYTISIGAIDNCGKTPTYAEQCPATLAVTFSGGTDPKSTKHITTTDLNGKCTTQHTGTSAASPLAAGVIALLLEANPKLSWRDVQHLIVNTSKVINDDETSKWTTNGAGRKVSEYYGFGVLDAEKLVEAATSPNWKTVEPQTVCNTTEELSRAVIVSNQEVVRTVETQACRSNHSANCVDTLEYVQVILTLRSYPRGGLQIFLTSPAGTKSPILKWRDDDGNDVFADWAFSSVFHWGENPIGKWKISITQHHPFGGIGTLLKWKLRFYGTCSKKGYEKDGDQGIKDKTDSTVDKPSVVSQSNNNKSSGETTETEEEAVAVNTVQSSPAVSVTPALPTTSSSISNLPASQTTTLEDRVASSTSIKTLPVTSSTTAINPSSIEKDQSKASAKSSVVTKLNIQPTEILTSSNLHKDEKPTTRSAIDHSSTLTSTKSTRHVQSSFNKQVNTPSIRTTVSNIIPSTSLKSVKRDQPTLLPERNVENVINTSYKSSTVIMSSFSSNHFVLGSVSSRTNTVETIKKTPSFRLKSSSSTETFSRSKSIESLGSTSTKSFARFSPKTIGISISASKSKTTSPTSILPSTPKIATTKTTKTTSTTTVTTKSTTATTKSTTATTATAPIKPVTTATTNITSATASKTTTTTPPQTPKPITTTTKTTTFIRNATASKLPEKPNNSDKANKEKLTLYIGVSIAALIVLFIVLTGIAFGVRKYLNEKPVLVKQQREISYVNNAYVPSKNTDYYR